MEKTLSKRQKLTLQHLKHFNDVTNPEDIIAYCKGQLSITGRKRKNSRKYYIEIIESFSA
jgi:hypothetical protein